MQTNQKRPMPASKAILMQWMSKSPMAMARLNPFRFLDL